MFSDYLTWWAAQMLQWLPARFTKRDRGVAYALIVQTFGNDLAPEVEIVMRHRHQERTLGRFGLDDAGQHALQAALPARPRQQMTLLRLPPEMLLEREVVLPLAAERELDRVLTYEMDRITPFASAEVFWTYAIERRDRALGRLHLRLSLVTRVAVEALTDVLTRLDLAPTMLEVRNDDGIRRWIAMRRPDSRYDRLARRSLHFAASACAVLVLAVIGFPFVLQTVEQGRLEARIASLRPAVAEVEKLRHRIATNTAGVDVVETERIRDGDVLDVLAALTGLLPDDTYLSDFAMRQGKLTMSGQSAAAVRLIAALSGDPVVRNPEFVAPVTRFDNRADLFAIRAEIAR